MEDHIRNLCRKLTEADDGGQEFKTIALDLQTALSKHIGEMRERLQDYPLAKERRSING
jgi:hypothetical protein